jgi:cell division protein FtsB
MKPLAWTLGALILLLQYPLWLGKGSWLRVWELERDIQAQRKANLALDARNQQLAAEAGDLHSGYDALEERARFEIGMVRGSEVFFHVIEPGTPPRPEKKP